MPSSAELRQKLLIEVNDSLKTTGLSRDRFEEIKDLRVAPSWTVEDFVKARIDFLEVKIKDDKFVTDLSRIRIYRELDPETEDLLRRRIAETGQTVTEFILETIKSALSESD